MKQLFRLLGFILVAKK